MKRINSRQYKILQNFCREIFKTQNYISQRSLNLLIQQKLNPCSTRYRRNLIDLKFLSEKHKLIRPGEMLYYFKQKDFYAVNKLLKIGNVKIRNTEIHFTSEIESFQSIEIPENWELKEKTKTKLIFNVKNITTYH